MLVFEDSCELSCLNIGETTCKIMTDCNSNTVVYSEEVKTAAATCGNVVIDRWLTLQTIRRQSRHSTLQKQPRQRHCLSHFVSL